MKFVSICIFASVVLSACGSSKGSGGDSISPAQSKAVGADGQCTAAVIRDTEKLTTESVAYLSKVADLAVETLDDSKKVDTMRRQETLNNELQATVQAYRSTYGSFTCQYIENGYLMKLDPTPLYKVTDELSKPIEVQKSTAIGKDGECTPELKTDYKELTVKLKAPLSAMMGAISRGMNKINAGQSGAAEIAIAKAESQNALDLVVAFRSKYQTFACNIIDEDGQTQVLSSDEFDQQIQKLRDQISKL